MNSFCDLTIDICVLMSGSGIGNKNYYQTSSILMKIMKKNKKFYLAIDSRGKILNQYLRILKQGTFGHQWLIEMLGKNRIKKIPWIHIHHGLIAELAKARFVRGEDLNYVVTSAGSKCKFLVSHDPDYSNQVCIILSRRLGVTVKTAFECHEL